MTKQKMTIELSEEITTEDLKDCLYTINDSLSMHRDMIFENVSTQEIGHDFFSYQCMKLEQLYGARIILKAVNDSLIKKEQLKLKSQKKKLGLKSVS